MAQIAIRNGPDEPWSFVDSTSYRDEAFLRDLIFEEPALVPAADMGLPADVRAVAIREFGLPGGGAGDVILIYSEGSVAIVECKLATNPERKRAVVGQILDYAASLATLTYDEVDARVRTRNGRPLAELMEQAANSDQWDEDAFVQGVTDSLGSGSFKLAVAIDRMDSDLARLLRYMSTQSRGALQIFGLELRYHASGATEAIVPHIGNPVGRDVSPAPPTRVWGPDEFRAELAKLPDRGVRAALEDLLDFALNHAAGLYWGRSRQYGTFGYGITRPDGRVMSLFTCYSTGAFYLNMGTLRQRVPTRAVEAFVASVGPLPGMERVNTHLAYPQFQMRDTIAEDGARAAFKTAVQRLQNAVVDGE